MKCIWEHNGNDTLLYSADFPGAFARGRSLKEALAKIPGEAVSYAKWQGLSCTENTNIEIVQEKASSLNIADADSDVLFDTEKAPLSMEEYLHLKGMALKSAGDFLKLYESIPDPDKSCLPERKTFYGMVPRTAREMYAHTKNVNAYYFGEIGITADNEGDIFDCRAKGFELLEKAGDYLSNRVFDGSYGEQWSLRKVLRRFIWHDRIHAKAMYRMAVKTFSDAEIENPFFEL